MDYGMLYLQPWGCLMLLSQRGASTTLLTVFLSENRISLKKMGWGVKGEHLICTLQLAELELELPFYFDVLFLMAELQEV